MEFPNWDVSDIDPTTMFPKDCRYYNGGMIAPKEVRRFWVTNEEEDENSGKKGDDGKNG